MYLHTHTLKHIITLFAFTFFYETINYIKEKKTVIFYVMK